MCNSEKFPEAWKIYIDCVRKWQSTDKSNYPSGWKYGIPNPKKTAEYLYSDCPGKLFVKFKDLFYFNYGITGFKKFLWELELNEGKITQQEYKSNLRFLLQN